MSRSFRKMSSSANKPDSFTPRVIFKKYDQMGISESKWSKSSFDMLFLIKSTIGKAIMKFHLKLYLASMSSCSSSRKYSSAPPPAFALVKYAIWIRSVYMQKVNYEGDSLPLPPQKDLQQTQILLDMQRATWQWLASALSANWSGGPQSMSFDPPCRVG